VYHPWVKDARQSGSGQSLHLGALSTVSKRCDGSEAAVCHSVRLGRGQVRRESSITGLARSAVSRLWKASKGGRLLS